MDSETRRELKKQARKLDRARASEAEAWDELRAMMKRAHEDEGGTFSEIGEVVGVTKARVYQIVTGNRGGRKPVTAAAADDENLVDVAS